LLTGDERKFMIAHGAIQKPPAPVRVISSPVLTGLEPPSRVNTHHAPYGRDSVGAV
jgi:hypothetical protein